MAQQSGSSANPQYSPQHYLPDAHHTRVSLNSGVLVEQGQLIVLPQHQGHYFTQQKLFPNPAVQTPIEDPAYTKLVDGVLSGKSNRYGLVDVDATPNFKASSIVTAERRYFCSCGKGYSQPQGVLRHRRAAHNEPYSCFSLPCRFKWTRPCEYRVHLRKRHPKVNSDKVLGKPAGDRCRSTIIGRDLVPSQAKPRQRLMTPPLPTLAKVTHVPSPAVSPVACNPQPEYAEPAVVTTRKHEDARGLEFLGVVDASAFSSTEECAQSVNIWDISIQDGQNWLVHTFFT